MGQEEEEMDISNIVITKKNIIQTERQKGRKNRK